MTECAAEAARVARAVRPAQLDSSATPCAGWGVRGLVNHWVLYTSHGMEHRALRTEIPEELTTRDFTADADWAERYAAQLDRAVAAWSDPAVWEGTIGEGDSASPAADTAEMLIMETALHGWDVARATGQEFRLSDGTAKLRTEDRGEDGRALPAVRGLRRRDPRREPGVRFRAGPGPERSRSAVDRRLKVAQPGSH